jgi:hypothetical protein
MAVAFGNWRLRQPITLSLGRKCASDGCQIRRYPESHARTKFGYLRGISLELAYSPVQRCGRRVKQACNPAFDLPYPAD